MIRLNGVGPYAAFAVTSLMILVLFLRPEPMTDQPREETARMERLASQSEELDRRCGATLRRNKAKERIARQVIVGRLSLLDAAERFRDLSDSDPYHNWEVFRIGYGEASSDDERFCRQVIATVRVELEATDPARALCLVGRLEAELEGSLRAGALRLPD